MLLYGLLRRALKPLFRPRFPRHFTARTTYVCDGDSIWVAPRWGGRRKLRLLGMDAPETDQAFGPEATRCLRRKLSGAVLDVTALGVDPYGRLISRVMIGRTDVSEFMIREGLAWPYRRYYRRLSQEEALRYDAACRMAKSKRLGLWREKNPTPPWVWRERQRTWLSRFWFWLSRLWKRFF